MVKRLDALVKLSKATGHISEPVHNLVTYFPKTHFNRPITLPPLLGPTFFKPCTALTYVSLGQLIATRNLFLCVCGVCVCVWCVCGVCVCVCGVCVVCGVCMCVWCVCVCVWCVCMCVCVVCVYV